MRRKLRKCKICGAKEKINWLGFSNIAHFLCVCADCINKANKQLERKVRQ